MATFARTALAFLCLALAGYAVAAYGLLPVGALVHPDLKPGFEAHAVALRLHIFGAAVAMALGPWQFWGRLRARRPRLHRAMGRAYLGVGVAVGGSAGLYVAQHAIGGPVAGAGFTLLASAWLFTGWRAYAAIRAGRVAEHRAWMLQNFALTLAALTLRLYLAAALIGGVAFEVAYPAIAWLCWVPNLVVARLALARAARPESAAPGGRAPARA